MDISWHRPIQNGVGKTRQPGISSGNIRPVGGGLAIEAGSDANGGGMALEGDRGFAGDGNTNPCREIAIDHDCFNQPGR